MQDQNGKYNYLKRVSNNLGAISLLQDLMSDDNERECKATAEEQHHHAQQAPLVLNRKRQVLQKDTVKQKIFTRALLKLFIT